MACKDVKCRPKLKTWRRVQGAVSGYQYGLGAGPETLFSMANRGEGAPWTMGVHC